MTPRMISDRLLNLIQSGRVVNDDLAYSYINQGIKVCGIVWAFTSSIILFSFLFSQLEFCLIALSINSASWAVLASSYYRLRSRLDACIVQNVLNS